MAERRTRGPARVRRRERKNVPRGNAYIQSSFNNTIVTITDPDGNVLTWGSSGAAGFKGSRKSTPYAAALAADSAARKAMEHGMRQVSVFVRGPGAGREAAIRSLQAAGLEVTAIVDARPSHTTAAARRRRGASDGRCRPVCRLCRQGMKPSLKGDAASPKVRCRTPPTPPAPARRSSRRKANSTSSSRKAEVDISTASSMPVPQHFLPPIPARRDRRKPLARTRAP